MAKRVKKTAADTKQDAAVRRTKKTKTPVKKTPVKKSPVKKQTNVVIGGNAKTTKTAKTVTKTGMELFCVCSKTVHLAFKSVYMLVLVKPIPN